MNKKPLFPGKDTVHQKHILTEKVEKGDYFRYLAEFKSSGDHKEVKD
ncbi:hypothetical protein Lser_V15G36628 [Lactuca serriola]